MDSLKDRHLGLRVSLCNKIWISPRYFKDVLDGKIVEEDKSYFDIGTKTHMFLLEAEKFKENYTYLEFNTPGSPKQKEFCETLVAAKKKNSILDTKYSDLAPKIYKKIYRTDKKSDDKIKEEALKLTDSLKKYIEYLSAKEVYKDVLNYHTVSFLNTAKLQVNKHKLAKSLIYPDTEHLTEYMIYWEHPEIKINNEPAVIRSTIDRLIIDHNKKVITLVDLKTSSTLHKFDEKFLLYKYHMQLAAYWLAVFYEFSKSPDLRNKYKDYTYETYIVGIQTPDNYGGNLPIECRVFKISEETLSEGLAELNKTFDTISWHFDNDKWDHTKSYYENNGIDKIL